MGTVGTEDSALQGPSRQASTQLTPTPRRCEALQAASLQGRRLSHLAGRLAYQEVVHPAAHLVALHLVAWKRGGV